MITGERPQTVVSLPEIDKHSLWLKIENPDQYYLRAYNQDRGIWVDFWNDEFDIILNDISIINTHLTNIDNEIIDINTNITYNYTELHADVVRIDSDISILNTNLATEITNRINGDHTLQLAISDVASDLDSNVIRIDSDISTLQTNVTTALKGAIWKSEVATFADITTTYPIPVQYWTVNVKDTGYTYQYNDIDGWHMIDSNYIPLATTLIDGRLNKEDKLKLNNTSNTNTGDETKSTIESKLLCSTLTTTSKEVVGAINELETKVITIIESSDVGFIKMYPMPTPPNGYLLCNGASLDRTTYAALFAIIGITFGGGTDEDNGTTFSLPNYINKTLFGAGDLYNSTSYGGRTTQTLNIHNIPPHQHLDGIESSDADTSVFTYGAYINERKNQSRVEISGASNNYQGLTSSSIYDGVSFNNYTNAFDIMPPYAAVYYVIKY